MADMTFKYTIQPYQTEAVDSVAGVFAGQPFCGRSSASPDPETAFAGCANAPVQLSSAALLENIRRIQTQNHLQCSDAMQQDGLGCCTLDVEMETGTGKTYVYIKTIFELNRRYGWSKFIVVVPSIAIREGVKKSFETTQDHFMEHYGKKARWFVYDAKKLAPVDNFSKSADLHVMIINMQAFNARGADARRIRTELDAFSARRPIDVISGNRPILILDEPQKMGGRATQEGLREFDPLFCLNYSATHKQHHALVYVLDALDAYRMRLVKRIEVKGITLRNLRGTDGYLYLERIVLSPKHPPAACMELEIGYGKSVNRETRLLREGDDLFPLSKGMEQYRGFRVSEVDPVRGTVTFINGTVISAGETRGDLSEADLRRIQIRETVRSHFEKEQALFSRGIKVLSLFFIDTVAKYRRYDAEGNEVNSEYGAVFEEEYAAVMQEYLGAAEDPYAQYLRGIAPQQTHAGYFSIDKKGRKTDSPLRRNSDVSDDLSAYDLILRDKERLLSFENPVRFIFSHSALREGWDNPNVFQICTLKHGGSSPAQKRQEVGRGLRLCVDRNGERQDSHVLGNAVQQVNRLTVIAADGYTEFAADLQRGIRADLCERPDQASPDIFIGRTVLTGGSAVTVSPQQGRDFYRYLTENGYIDREGHMTDRYRTDSARGTLLPVPESCREIAGGVHALVQRMFDAQILHEMIENGYETKLRENPLNGNFCSQAFQPLWEILRCKYAYTAALDSEALIRRAAAYLDENLSVARMQYTVTSGEQKQDLAFSQLTGGKGFAAGKSRTQTLERAGYSAASYDLVGRIAEGAKLTRRSAGQILERIAPQTFAMFGENPEEFIRKAIRLIREQKALLAAEHISYHKTGECYGSDIFALEKPADLSCGYRAKKNIQDYVLSDGYAKNGKNTEREFARALDASEAVCVYAKLPQSFTIPTPVGDYTPDWAIVFHPGMAKHRFLLADTKRAAGAAVSAQTERSKIRCAGALFAAFSVEDIAFCEAESFQQLLQITEQL